jgi:hypothetical protein
MSKGMEYDMIRLTMKLSPRSRKALLTVVVVLIVAYIGMGAYIWHAMQEPPEDFARIMAKMPGPVVFLLFPFETLWTRARVGNLNIGDTAPDFSLANVDKSGTVQLSKLNSQQPVVLVFGSYT